MISLRAKEEYLRAVHGRYRQATRAAKGQILDEFCATTGYHRKSADTPAVLSRVRRSADPRRWPRGRASPG